MSGYSFDPTRAARRHRVLGVLGVTLALAFGVARAQFYDAPGPADWCFDLPSASRADNTTARFSCGNCEGLIPSVSCANDTDCPNGEACIDRVEQTLGEPPLIAAAPSGSTA